MLFWTLCKFLIQGYAVFCLLRLGFMTPKNETEYSVLNPYVFQKPRLRPGYGLPDPDFTL